MGFFDDLVPQRADSGAPVQITVRPQSRAADLTPEGYASNPRGYSVGDVQAAVRGDMFNSPGLPIKYEAQPGQTYGVAATRDAKPFDSIVAHHTGGPTLQGALNTARNGDPFRSDVKYGYHFYIDKDGTVVQGAPMDARTNHVQPPGASQRTTRPDISNSNAVGISFVGDSSNPTPEQLSAAQNLSRSLMERYGIQPENVVGHGQIQANRQTAEGMPLVNAIRNGPAVAEAPPQWQGPQTGGVANAAPQAPPQAAPQPPKASGLFSDLIPQQPDKRPDIGRGNAAMLGIGQGLSANFGDELTGARAAAGMSTASRIVAAAMPMGGLVEPAVGLARLGYEYLTGGDEAAKRYTAARDEFRSADKAAKEQYPGTYVGSNIAGAVLLPLGGAMNAATLPARMGRGAVVGAGFGGLSGAGEGTNTDERVSRAAGGALVGGAIGAAAPPVVEGVIRAGRYVGTGAANAIRGVRDPEGEAARRAATAIQTDLQRDPQAVGRLTPQEFVGAPNARVMDMGGETTRALARSAANTSPAGRQTLNTTINERFEGQSGRLSDWLRGAFNYPNAHAQQRAIDTVERTVNRGNYRAAYNAGDRPVVSPELERLIGAPAVQDAIRAAITTGKDRAINDGFGAFRSPFTITADGQLVANRGPSGVPTFPNLQFWDYTRRELSDAARKAGRAGANDEAARLGGLATAMNRELDRLVPEYQSARAGAARFFGAEDALEAGQNFVGAGSRFGLPEARQAMARMSPLERQLFQDGYVSRYIETLERVPDRRNVLNQIAQSAPARAELNLALGPQRAAELEARLRIEGIMDLARGAVQGNSTTARQLAELGLAGGAYGVGTGLDVFNPNPSAIMAAAFTYGALRGKARINENVSRQVAELLTSNDPRRLLRGIQAVVRNQQLFNSLRATDQGLARVGIQQAPTPAMQMPMMGRTEDDKPAVPRPPGQ